MPDLPAPHEPAPYVAAAQIFSAEKGNPDIDADHVFVRPAVRRMKSIDESVALVDAVPKHAVHFHERWNTYLGSEHQRAPGSAGNHRPVDILGRRRAAPRLITMCGVGSRDTPNVVRIAGKLALEVDTELPMGKRRLHGVVEPVRMRFLLLMAVPEIDPGLRVLMHKERGRTTNVGVAGVGDRRP